MAQPSLLLLLPPSPVAKTALNVKASAPEQKPGLYPDNRDSIQLRYLYFPVIQEEILEDNVYATDPAIYHLFVSSLAGKLYVRCTALPLAIALTAT